MTAPFGPGTAAQPTERRWTIVVNHEPWHWLSPPRGDTDDAGMAAQSALQALHGAGFFRSSIDSVEVDPGLVHVDPGDRINVEAAELVWPEAPPVGQPELDAWTKAFADSLANRSFSAAALRMAVARVLSTLEAAGFPRAEVRVTRFLFRSEHGGLDLSVDVDPGRRPLVQGLLLQGARRTRAATIERILDIRPGRVLAAFDSVSLRRRLEASGLFLHVDTPVLLSTGDSTAVLQVVVEEAAPGAFDAALGYQPPVAGRGGGLVGTGRLELLNPLGGGRQFSVLFDRLTGQVSRAEISAYDPAVAGSPFGAELDFKGLQQDSTFGRQSFGITGLLELLTDLDLTVSWTSERVSPGTAGARITESRQQVARSDAGFLGVGFRAGRLDDRLNPGSGLRVEARVERGTTRRTTLIVQSDTTVVGSQHRVERLFAMARWFRPLGGRRVVALGLDASVLVSPEVDRGDLLRLGGAKSLRGYDEDRFEGRAIGRLLAEMRQRIDARSYAYLFADVGFVDVPPARGLVPGSAIHPGFGFGIQLDTAAGLVLATYGFNPDDGPTRGRVHVSFSFGL